MKILINKALQRLGFNDSSIPAPGMPSRPIGRIREFLEDVLVRGFCPRGIIDVGANRGNWTEMARVVFPQAKVLMIEPQIEMQAVLKQRCQACGDLEYVQAGAGSDNGQLVQTIWDDLAGSSFLPKVDEEKLAAGRQRVTNIVTIDSLLRERAWFYPDLVKLDIQGFELEALRGAQSLFGRTELFIMEISLYAFLENQPTAYGCIEFMNERGYDIYDIPGYLRRPYDGSLGQIDIAFAMRDGFLRGSNKWNA